MSLASDIIAPAAVPDLQSITRELPNDHFYATANLLDLLPAHGGVSWVLDGEGLVGWGEATRLVVRGRERFSRAQRWWTDVVAAASVTDPVELSGTGMVAFASFAFEPGRSVVVVPRVVVGRRNGVTWLTIIQNQNEPLSEAEFWIGERDAAYPIGEVTWEEGTQPESVWQRRVGEAVERIERGEIDKIVLARDVVAHSNEPLDTRNLLTRLASRYPECWAFAVDGLVGATPELLVKRHNDSVSSRVLAGTIRRDKDQDKDANLAERLLASDKDQAEHEYAVSSVAQALAAHCTDLDVPSHPELLQLANVQHLSTDIHGRLAGNVPVLSLIASLHPTAAVCGTPTERAANLIRTLEGMDRERYAGPVGWMNASGDGEFGIALRCGQIDAADNRRIRLFAGCGIVAGSDPVAELAESNAKLEPMRYALRRD